MHTMGSLIERLRYYKMRFFKEKRHLCTFYHGLTPDVNYREFTVCENLPNNLLNILILTFLWSNSTTF